MDTGERFVFLLLLIVRESLFLIDKITLISRGLLL